jgi:uncharacterized protein involved in type VI secretion and phage assembly
MALFDTIRRIVEDELRRVRTVELAVVQERHLHADGSDKDNYACTVQLRNSGIVLKKVPVAVSRIGANCLPEVGNLVLVQFFGGSINGPVITGCVYSEEERPPVTAEGQQITHLPLGAGDADAVHIEIQSGSARKIAVALGNGISLSLQDDDPAVELKVDTDKAVLTIAKDGSVSLESKSDIKIKGRTVSIEAEQGLTLKGQRVDIN